MGSFLPASSLVSFSGFCPNVEQIPVAGAGMELLKVGQSWSLQAPGLGSVWHGHQRMGVPWQEFLVFLVCLCPAETQLEFLQESLCFADLREGFPGSGTVELQTWISVLLYPPRRFFSLLLFMAPVSHTEFSLLAGLINPWEYIHPSHFRDSFCLLKNTSLFFPCKGSHAGAHLCFPHASTGSFTTLNPWESWENWV